MPPRHSHRDHKHRDQNSKDSTPVNRNRNVDVKVAADVNIDVKVDNFHPHVISSPPVTAIVPVDPTTTTPNARLLYIRQSCYPHLHVLLDYIGHKSNETWTRMRDKNLHNKIQSIQCAHTQVFGHEQSIQQYAMTAPECRYANEDTLCQQSISTLSDFWLVIEQSLHYNLDQPSVSSKSKYLSALLLCTKTLLHARMLKYMCGNKVLFNQHYYLWDTCTRLCERHSLPLQKSPCRLSIQIMRSRGFSHLLVLENKIPELKQWWLTHTCEFPLVMMTLVLEYVGFVTTFQIANQLSPMNHRHIMNSVFLHHEPYHKLLFHHEIPDIREQRVENINIYALIITDYVFGELSSLRQRGQMEQFLIYLFITRYDQHNALEETIAIRIPAHVLHSHYRSNTTLMKRRRSIPYSCVPEDEIPTTCGFCKRLVDLHLCTICGIYACEECNGLHRYTHDREHMDIEWENATQFEMVWSPALGTRDGKSTELLDGSTTTKKHFEPIRQLVTTLASMGYGFFVIHF